MSTRRVLIYSRFERFWHWSQMALIMLLMFTGFAIHGLHDVLKFGKAYEWHLFAAAGLMLLWIFAIFWHLTSGTWRHYLPTRHGLWQVWRFYTYGIFNGEHHPYRKAYWRKHNPLQVAAYLSLKLFLFPIIWFSGLALFFYFIWYDSSGAATWFERLSLIHTLAAFAMLAFVIAHVYLLTTGHSLREHVMPMISGFDHIDLSPEEEAYLSKDRPGHLR